MKTKNKFPDLVDKLKKIARESETQAAKNGKFDLGAGEIFGTL